MPGSSQPTSPRAHPGRTSLFLCLAACLVFLVPWDAPRWAFVNVGDISVDAAFIVAMPVLFANGAHFGPDIVFTYGPWGMLASEIRPWSLYGLVIALRTVFACGIAVAVWDVVFRRKANRPDAAGALMMLALMFWLWIGGVQQSIWLVPSLYLGVLYAFDIEENPDHARRRLALFLSACAGLAGLVKFNVFVFALGVQLVLLVLDLTARRVPVIFIAWLAAVAVAWLGAGQSLPDLWTWIVSGLDLSTGYSDAMAKGFWDPFSPARVAVIAVGLIAFGVYGLSIASQASKVRTGLAIVASLGLCGALAWQHAIGGNQLPSAMGEVLTAILVASGIPRSTARPLNTSVRKFSFAIVSIVLLLWALIGSGGLIYVSGTKENVISKVDGLKALFTEGFARQRTQWDNMLASARKHAPLPPDLHGTADAYPQHTAVVIADPRLTYDPRPAYLSVGAYTLALAQQNAEFLETRGPQNILMDVLPASESVDNRLPSTADGPSWPLMWTHYALVGQTPNFLILTRRKEPLPMTTTPLLSRAIGWNETVALPESQTRTTWATVKLHRSLLGRIVKNIYKSPLVHLEMTLANGSRRSYQIVPGLGEAGFLLSPFVIDNASLARLIHNVASESGSRNAVTSISFKTEPGTQWFWSPSIDISLSELVVNDGKPVSVPDEFLKSMSLSELRQNAGKCLFPPAIGAVPDATGPISLFHAPCETSLAIPVGATGVQLSYGIGFAERSGGTNTDGAAVKIVAVDASDRPVQEFTRDLDPVRQTGDRGIQTTTLSWAPGTATKMVISFGAGANNDPTYDHTYVSAIKFVTPH